MDHLVFGKNNVELKGESGSPIAGYFSLTNFPHGLQLEWTPNSRNSEITSRDITLRELTLRELTLHDSDAKSRGSITCNGEMEARGSEVADMGCNNRVIIVLEWVKALTTLNTLMDQHFLVTSFNLKKLVFGFNKGGLDRLTQVLMRWAYVQKSEAAESPTGVFIVPNNRSIIYPSLNLELWQRYIYKSGRISGVRQLRRLIYEGCVSDEARGAVWRCLLSLHNYSHTHRQQAFRNKLLADKYRDIKAKVPDFDEDTEERKMFTTAITEIEKDCCRTDSHNPFISGEDNPNQAVLKRILISYYLYRPEIGYVQGMSDLLVPIFSVIREEFEVFWCFDNLMNRSAFSRQQHCNLYHQLAFLREVLGLLFPDIYVYFSTTGDALTLTCCHRWFLLFFKREFSSPSLLKLWDVILAAPSLHFQVFISAAMITLYFPPLISRDSSSTELLMSTQQLAGTFDLNSVLKRARTIYQDLVNLPEVPCSLIPLVGGSGEEAGMWDRARDVTFSCFECSRESCCEAKRSYLAELRRG